MLLTALLVGLVCETLLIKAGVLLVPGPLPPVSLLYLWLLTPEGLARLLIGAVWPVAFPLLNLIHRRLLP